jgi:hypothetical protein
MCTIPNCTVDVIRMAMYSKRTLLYGFILDMTSRSPIGNREDSNYAAAEIGGVDPSFRRAETTRRDGQATWCAEYCWERGGGG